MSIDNYLLKHTITRIGNGLSEYVCCETIVDNPIELVSVVAENNCYISVIRWWERAKIAIGPTIGYGGVRDPRCPEEYFFAETDIYKIFESASTEDDYCRYIEQVKKEYANLDLFPAFDIKII